MPTSKKFLSINSYQKISDDLFYAFILIFTFIPSFLNFFPDESPPYLGRPGPFLTIYPYFTYLLTLFSENSLVGCPPGWMPGAVAPTRTPLCTPLLIADLVAGYEKIVC